MVLLAAAMIEIGVAGWLLAGRGSNEGLILLVSLCALMVAYRLSLGLAGQAAPCKCFGKMGELVNLTPWQASNLAVLLLGYMAVGGCYFLAAPRFMRTARKGGGI